VKYSKGGGDDSPDVIDLVALDADDTLGHNEPMYTSARERF
jgi:hypothetical protein